MISLRACALLAAASLVLSCGPSSAPTAQQEADAFLASYNGYLQPVYTADVEANWKASTDVTEQHTGERIGADNVYAAFAGSPLVINTTKSLLERRAELDDITVRQLEKIIISAANYPGTIPDVVAARIKQEAEQSATLDGFEFCDQRSGDTCAKPITPNEIDNILRDETNLARRQHIWEVSKQSGPALKPGLIELRRLRNDVAKEMGYSSFFALQVSDYGMSVAEMMALMEQFQTDLKPLYEQVHTYAKYELAKRYNQPPPKRIPAHWIGNRWAQDWPGLASGVDLDSYVKGKDPKWIVEQGEKFYTSLGMPELPETFWEKSDLYPVAPGSDRRKNTHASAWHVDLANDVRSLMSVEGNYRWFETSHHELGHVYYFLGYSNPNVPLTLREGANRAFHEAIGDLIGIAARQPVYL
jgi:peptidyl-dipeptidase A